MVQGLYLYEISRDMYEMSEGENKKSLKKKLENDPDVGSQVFVPEYLGDLKTHGFIVPGHLRSFFDRFGPPRKIDYLSVFFDAEGSENLKENFSGRPMENFLRIFSQIRSGELPEMCVKSFKHGSIFSGFHTSRFGVTPLAYTHRGENEHILDGKKYVARELITPGIKQGIQCGVDTVGKLGTKFRSMLLN